MLVLLENIAAVLSRVRRVIQALFLLSAVWTAWLLLAASVAVQDQWLIPGIVLTLWLLMAMSVILLFRRPATLNEETAGRWQRFRAKIGRWLMQGFAWVVIGICLALVVISLQLTMNWFRYH